MYFAYWFSANMQKRFESLFDQKIANNNIAPPLCSYVILNPVWHYRTFFVFLFLLL